MPITLAQAKVGMANHVDQQVIDQFRRGSMLLNALTFDNSVSPGTGGSTLTYGYTQLKTPAGADFRDINADYTDTVADRETKSVDLKIFGGTFKIDRVLANTANGQISESAVPARGAHQGDHQPVPLHRHQRRQGHQGL
ncbi:MAG: hypothetical protein ACLR4Z_01240 [Butyricicoccaceae bacterium]